MTEKVEGDLGEIEKPVEKETNMEEGKEKVPRKKELTFTSSRGKSSMSVGGKEAKEVPKARMNYQVIQCDFCPMKYHKWSAFYIHRCTHTGETPAIPCGVCEMEFPNIKGVPV